MTTAHVKSVRTRFCPEQVKDGFEYRLFRSVWPRCVTLFLTVLLRFNRRHRALSTSVLSTIVAVHGERPAFLPSVERDHVFTVLRSCVRASSDVMRLFVSFVASCSFRCSPAMFALVRRRSVSCVAERFANVRWTKPCATTLARRRFRPGSLA